MNAEPHRGWPRGLLALRSRNFLLYFTGHFTSQVGTWIEQTAVAWILYELTDSAVLLGLGGLFRAAPMILLALPGGAIADRVRHRRLLAATESIMFAVAVTMGVLAATDQLQFWHLYLLNLASGTLYAFSVPARQALFPALVARDALPSAVTLNSAAARSAAFIGPSIAGLTLAFSGYAAPFFLNAASFVAMLAALAAMRLPRAVHAPQTARLGLRNDMGEGVKFVRRSDLLTAVLTLEFLAGLFGHNSAIVTIMARDVLGAGPQGLGALLSALSAGALFGMLLMVVRHTERRGRLILIAGGAYSLLLVGFAASSSLALSMALLFALGAADGVWGVARNTVVHLAIPDALRGRVMSMVFLVTRGSTPMGQLSSGVLAALIGAPATILLGAAMVGAAVARTGLRVPELRSPPDQ
jgi:MFS family permease